MHSHRLLVIPVAQSSSAQLAKPVPRQPLPEIPGQIDPILIALCLLRVSECIGTMVTLGFEFLYLTEKKGSDSPEGIASSARKRAPNAMALMQVTHIELESEFPPQQPYRRSVNFA